jgi:hypothetical protein
VRKENLSKAAVVLLTLAGGYMIYLGCKAGIQPPVITGIGFLLIAFIFFSSAGKN